MPTDSPNYTQIPNALLDGMADIDTPLLRVLLFVFRHTVGWHRERHVMSRSYIAHGTGLAESTVSDAVQVLMDANILNREKSGCSFAYGIVFSEPSSKSIFSLRMPGKKSLPVPPADRSTEPPTCPASGQLPVPPADRSPVPPADTSKETDTKERKKDPADAGMDLKEFRSQFVSGYQEVYYAATGEPYAHKGAADEKAVQRLFKGGHTPEKAIELAAWAFDQGNEFLRGCASTIMALSANWNRLIMARATQGKPKSNPEGNQRKEGLKCKILNFLPPSSKPDSQNVP